MWLVAKSDRDQILPPITNLATFGLKWHNLWLVAKSDRDGHMVIFYRRIYYKEPLNGKTSDWWQNLIVIWICHQSLVLPFLPKSGTICDWWQNLIAIRFCHESQILPLLGKNGIICDWWQNLILKHINNYLPLLEII